jgi:N-acetylglucosamine-6-phosphate deacetylase
MFTVFVNAKVCDGKGGWDERPVVIAPDGRIAESFPAPDCIQTRVDCQGGWLAPGFVDVHVHGAMGCDTMDATPTAFDAITRWHASRGTTTLLLTTPCATWDDLNRVIDSIRAYLPLQSHGGARVAGLHVEGPYFSPEKLGAHPASLLRHPSQDRPEMLTNHADVIRRVTLAPELPGAIPLIEALAAAGIASSIGHTDAWDEEVQRAIEAGARNATHTFNCMSSARKRNGERVAGALEVVLGHPRVVCELIADGYHVSKALMQLALQAKRPDGLVLVSDATAGAGLGHGTDFGLGQLTGTTQNGRAVVSGTSVLAGSTIGLMDAVRTVVEICGVPVPQAVAMASYLPAKTLGMENEIGILASGARGDVVWFDDSLEIQGTWIGGMRI